MCAVALAAQILRAIGDVDVGTGQDPKLSSWGNIAVRTSTFDGVGHETSIDHRRNKEE